MPALALMADWFCGWVTRSLNPRSELSVVFVRPAVTCGWTNDLVWRSSASARWMFAAASATVGFCSIARRTASSNSTFGIVCATDGAARQTRSRMLALTRNARAGLDTDRWTAGPWGPADEASDLLRMRASRLRQLVGDTGGVLRATGSNRADRDIQDRDEDDRQERRRDHAAGDGRADRLTGGRARARGERERHDAEDERQRCHQNRPQTNAGRLDRSIDDRMPLRAQVLRELDDQNRVLGCETDEHDQADLAEH